MVSGRLMLGRVSIRSGGRGEAGRAANSDWLAAGRAIAVVAGSVLGLVSKGDEVTGAGGTTTAGTEMGSGLVVVADDEAGGIQTGWYWGHQLSWPSWGRRLHDGQAGI
jgi:hypothetical protein